MNGLYSEKFHGANGTVRQPVPASLGNWMRSGFEWLRMMPAVAVSNIRIGDRPPTSGVAQTLNLIGKTAPNATGGLEVMHDGGNY